MEAGIEGELLIDLSLRRGRVSHVGIRSTRPLQMPSIFFGKTPAEVIDTLPLIYSVCGIAQGCAAAEALEQAMSIPVSLPNRRKRRLLVAFETVKEHVWRVELDWARFLNRVPDRAGIVQVVSLMKGFRTTLFAGQNPFTQGNSKLQVRSVQLATQLNDLERLLVTRVFSLPSQSWLNIGDRHDLSKWSCRRDTLAQEMLFLVEHEGAAGLGQAQVTMLGELNAAYLERRLTGMDADKFIAQPDWLDAPAETSPYTRRFGHPMLISLGKRYGNGLLTRLAARLVELAALVGELRAGVVGLDPSGINGSGSGSVSGTGISQVEAARGRLVHRVKLIAGRVSNYQILAPTEWNFHPKGVLANGLAGLEADSESSLKRRADLLINAVDPCVAYQLRINRPEVEST